MNIEQSETSPLEPGDIKDRLTVVLMLHHRFQLEQPHSVQNSFNTTLETSHEVYTRRCVATEDWIPLDIGWIPANDVGTVVIENLVGANQLLNPTKEQAERMAKKVIRIGNNDIWSLVHPGRCCFFVPENILMFRAYCDAGQANYRITVIPR